MATRKTGWNAWAAGIGALANTGTGFNAQTGQYTVGGAPATGTNPGVGFGPGTTRVPNTTTNPTTTSPTAAPWETDPVYQGQLAVGRQRLSSTLAALDNEQTTGLTRFGFTPDGQIDASNPFSQAALLKRNYDQSVRGTTNSMAARGQLYSGALQRQQRENRFGYDRGNFDLKTNFDAFMNELRNRRRSAQDQLDELGVTGRADAISRALGGY